MTIEKAKVILDLLRRNTKIKAPTAVTSISDKDLMELLATYILYQRIRQGTYAPKPR